jgi:hypothetical protein
MLASDAQSNGRLLDADRQPEFLEPVEVASSARSAIEDREPAPAGDRLLEQDPCVTPQPAEPEVSILGARSRLEHPIHLRQF